MSWKVFWTAFGTIFAAEFADKTQLATVAFSAQTGRPVTVFLASALALVAASALGAAAGGWLSRTVPLEWVRRGSAALFIVIGVWILVSEWRKPS